MTLLEDITAEREALADELEDIKQSIARQARHAISSGHSINPVVAAVAGTGVEIFDLRWRSSHEREKVFTSLNEQLTDINATASVLVMPGSVGEDVPAILIISRSPKGCERVAIPYRRERFGTVKWYKPVIGPAMDDELLQVPALN